MRRSILGPLALCALSSLTTLARADGEDDSKRAQALFDQAVESARGGDYRTACQQLEQSLKLHEGLGTQFHLAGCWQKIGRTASAYALFDQVASKAHDLGQTEREELARARLEAILPKLSRLRIDLANPAPHTEVQRDGEVVAESDWGKPLPVDPGTHEVRVTADGKAAWSSKIDVTEPAMTLAVQVPPLTDAMKEEPAKAAPAPAPEPKPAAKAPVATPAEPAPAANGSQRTIAIIVGGVGIAALGAGVLEGVQYLHYNRDAKGLCPGGIDCTVDEISQHKQDLADARTARTWAYVGVGVGGAALAAATYLYLTAPHGASASTERAKSFHVEPLADGRGTWGGALRGSF